MPNSNNNTHVAHQQRCARSPVSTTSRLASSGAGVLRWARAHGWPLRLSCGVPWSHGHAPQPHAPALVVASSLTACHSPTRYLATSTPVIIGGWTDRPMISREEILTVCGDRPLHDAPCDPTSPCPSPSPSPSPIPSPIPSARCGARLELGPQVEVDVLGEVVAAELLAVEPHLLSEGEGWGEGWGWGWG